MIIYIQYAHILSGNSHSITNFPSRSLAWQRPNRRQRPRHAYKRLYIVAAHRQIIIWPLKQVELQSCFLGIPRMAKQLFMTSTHDRTMYYGECPSFHGNHPWVRTLRFRGVGGGVGRKPSS